MAAVKQQRGYDADEELEAKSKWNCVNGKRQSRFYDGMKLLKSKFPKGGDVAWFSFHLMAQLFPMVIKCTWDASASSLLDTQ